MSEPSAELFPQTTHAHGDKYSVVYDHSSPEVYDAWAKDGYDDTVAANSVAVRSVSAVLARLIKAKGAGTEGAAAVPTYALLDAGCGTGRLAEVCREDVGGATLIFDGIDYSSGMLDVAKEKGTYRELLQADLTRPLSDLADGAYDGVVSSGTFLQGHVGPEALPELCRVLAPGGVMAFSVRPNFFDEKREQWLGALEAHGMREIAVDMLPYSRSGADGAPMLAPMVSCRKGGGE